MPPAPFQFDRFTLDPADRQLRHDGAPVELSARYLDALILLVREQGRLVTKDQFLEQVWQGVPVTDEALTQCIKTLRRQLGDNVAAPRFIETVPKHGYRFIALVNSDAPARAPIVPDESATPYSWRQFLQLGSAGMIGGGLAGLFGGIFYGFSGASQTLQPGMGALSILLVLICFNILIGLLAGAGVGFGIAAAGFALIHRWAWIIAGSAGGGLLVGAIVKLLGLDAFNLLVGRTPGDITGAAEGALLGGAIGLAVWLGSRTDSAHLLRRSVGAAGLMGGMAGVLITLLGGRLMGGSLAQLAKNFPDSRLHLDRIGALFGETGFGPISQIVTGGMEGVVFGGCIVGAMIIAGGARLFWSPARHE